MNSSKADIYVAAKVTRVISSGHYTVIALISVPSDSSCVHESVAIRSHFSLNVWHQMIGARPHAT